MGNSFGGFSPESLGFLEILGGAGMGLFCWRLQEWHAIKASLQLLLQKDRTGDHQWTT